MSISIIGSNGNKLVLITENKISNKFNDLELEYNLLTDKYLNKCNSMIIDRKCYNHYIQQLSYLFIKSNNINDFIKYINNRNSSTNLYFQTKIIVKDFDILNHLHKGILLINKKLNLNIKSGDFLYNIKKIIKKIQTMSLDKTIDSPTDYINENLLKIYNIIKSIKEIEIPSYYNENEILVDEKLFNTPSSNNINKIINSLANIIKMNNNINTNSTYLNDLIILINELTEKLTNVYLLI
jgi:hypothetical protein